VLAALYDIHGNLSALEAVLEDARELDVDRWLFGGDYGAWSPWPQETVELLRTLPNTTWLRGNGERWARELPWDRPEVVAMLENYDSGFGNDEGWLYSLQEHADIDGVEVGRPRAEPAAELFDVDPVRAPGGIGQRRTGQIPLDCRGCVHLGTIRAREGGVLPRPRSRARRFRGRGGHRRQGPARFPRGSIRARTGTANRDGVRPSRRPLPHAGRRRGRER